MDWSVFFEFYGLFAALVIAGSFVFKNVKPLRVVNLIGSLLFVGYGLYVKSYLLTLLYIFTAGINIYYLITLRFQSLNFDILRLSAAQDEFAAHFFKTHGDDIRRFFPSLDTDPKTGPLASCDCCFVLRETLPTSVVAFRWEKGEIQILLDYAIPAYRDFKNARFFFQQISTLIAIPGTVLNARGEVPAHTSYLRRIGFEEVGKEGDTVLFRLVLPENKTAVES
jgi:hypothetical protein